MGEILGIGTTHYPGLTGTDEGLSSTWQRIINAPRIDPKWKDRRNWPPGMLDEVGNDMGLAAAGRYRERMWRNFRQQRQMIDEFAPDFIVVIADDQYENFKEDIIPPFCVCGSTAISSRKCGDTASWPPRRISGANRTTGR
jgi:hypothetical protein